MLCYNAGSCCVVKKDKIHLIGGSSSEHGPLADMNIYNPGTGRWNFTSEPMKKSRNFAGAASLCIPYLPKSKYYTGL